MTRIDQPAGPVGTSPRHLSGVEHVTGRSQFVDDAPVLPGTLCVKVLVSPVAHGRIRLLDLEAAKTVPGVHAVLTHQDIPGVNQIGCIFQDETLLAEDEIHYIGEPIAAVAAETEAAAKQALAAIRLNIEELPAILTLEEAVRQNSFHGIATVERGDVEEAFRNAPHVLEGTAVNGGQEHFYLETQRTRVVVEDNGALTVYSATQNPSEIQGMVANVLGKSRVDVTVDVKRLGGGFGGKEAHATPWACLAALAAHCTGRPTSIVLDREEDLAWTGKRHPFESHYRIAFDDGGKILAYAVEMNQKGGAVADVSCSVMERALLLGDNIYDIPHVRLVGRTCRTHAVPNTAYRGYGAPQGIFAMESAVTAMARYLGMDELEIRLHNAYRSGSRTPCGQILEHCLATEAIERVRALSRWEERKASIAQFNTQNGFQRKGLALLPLKFGIAFSATFLNQGAALVQIYGDGSVSVTHGAIEMGQEVNTKVGQIVATVLGVPLRKLRVESNNTKRVANVPPTAASSGCDLNGQAAENAALQVQARLKDVAALHFSQQPGGPSPHAASIRLEHGWVFDVRAPETARMSWEDLVTNAFFQRVDLCAHGFHATPGIDFDRGAGRGNPFYYYVYGAAAAEVTVDLLTGHTQVDAVRIVHDAGRSLNPAVDLGQVQGAFAQGLGWCVMEELVYDPQGALLSCSPATYKIPTIGDIPRDLVVEFMESQAHDRNVQRSKAIGEPPFIYGEAVYFAICDALSSLGSYPNLSIPATPEQVLRAAMEIRGGPTA